MAIMAKQTVSYEIFDKFNQALINDLPMKDDRFLSQLKEFNLLPKDISSKVESCRRTKERASVFLDNVIKAGLLDDDCSHFTNLINVMIENTRENVVDLAQKIRGELVEVIIK